MRSPRRTTSPATIGSSPHSRRSRSTARRSASDGAPGLRRHQARRAHRRGARRGLPARRRHAGVRLAGGARQRRRHRRDARRVRGCRPARRVLGGAPVPSETLARRRRACAERDVAHALRDDRGAARRRHRPRRDRRGAARRSGRGCASGRRSTAPRCASCRSGSTPARVPAGAPSARRGRSSCRRRGCRRGTPACGTPNAARPPRRACWHRSGDVGHLDDGAGCGSRVAACT